MCGIGGPRKAGARGQTKIIQKACTFKMLHCVHHLVAPRKMFSGGWGCLAVAPGRLRTWPGGAPEAFYVTCTVQGGCLRCPSPCLALHSGPPLAPMPPKSSRFICRGRPSIEEWPRADRPDSPCKCQGLCEKSHMRVRQQVPGMWDIVGRPTICWRPQESSRASGFWVSISRHQAPYAR